MANKHLSNMPHHIRGRSDVWWYEEPKGIDVRIEDGRGGVLNVTIPWRPIEVALERKNRLPLPDPPAEAQADD